MGPTLSPPAFLYRFRPIKYLLGEKQELEKQEIFFASRKQLNDPLEGFKDFYWQGDSIIWENLLKNYLLCLEHVCFKYNLYDQDNHILEEDIPVHKTINNFSNDRSKNLFLNILKSFFSNELIQKVPYKISSLDNPIRKHELEYYLRQVHFIALDEILKVHIKEGTFNSRFDENILHNIGTIFLKEYLNKPNIDIKNSEEREKHFAHINEALNQSHLLFKLHHNEETPRNKEVLIHDFPFLYIKALENIAYGECYTASFLSQCNNSALWGYYAENHKGVCLKFKTTVKENNIFLNLKGINGVSSSKFSNDHYLKDYSQNQFYKINYTETPPEINFFENLGRLNVRDLKESWYIDDKGNKSSCSKKTFDNETSWRATYWHNLYRSYATKLKSWDHENEYRLILTEMVIDHSDDENRKMNYDLKDLDGVIFGINTSVLDKQAILSVLTRKAKKTENIDIKFYQAQHFKGHKDIEISELTQLRIKSK